MAERFRPSAAPPNPSTVVTPSPGIGTSGFSSGVLVWADANGALTNNSSGPVWSSVVNSLHLPGATTVTGALHVIGVTITNSDVTVNGGLSIASSADGDGLTIRNSGGGVMIHAESTGTTGKIGFWTTVGTTRPPPYNTTNNAQTTNRVFPAVNAQGAVYTSAIGAQLNRLQEIVYTLIAHDLTAGYGLLTTVV